MSSKNRVSTTILLVISYLKVLLAVLFFLASLIATLVFVPQVDSIVKYGLTIEQKYCYDDFFSAYNNNNDNNNNNNNDEYDSEDYNWRTTEINRQMSSDSKKIEEYHGCMENAIDNAMGLTTVVATVQVLSYFSIVLSVLSIGFSVYLVYGIHKRYPGILRRYMIYSVMTLVIYGLIYAAVAMNQLFTDGPFGGPNDMYYITESVFIGLGVYVLFLVYVFYVYKQMKSDNQYSHLAKSMAEANVNFGDKKILVENIAYVE